MRIVYLVLAHTDPAQLRRLVMALDGWDVFFVIHVDRKVDQTPFEFQEFKEKANVRFVVNRREVFWGGFSIVLATMDMVRLALEWVPNVDRVILMSGLCYPLKSNSHIQATLAAQPDSQFLDVFKLPTATSWSSQRGGLDRFELYHWMDNAWTNPRAPITGRLSRWVRKGALLLQRMLPRRKMYQGMVPYAGHQFWILNRACASYLVNRMDNDRGLNRFFQRTFGSDELMFTTVLMNSPLSSTIIPDPLRYVDWTREDPAILDERDFEKIRDSKALFGRKFTTERSTDLMARIDQEIRNNVIETGKYPSELS